ncbi:MAG: hypothetical protein ACLURV_10545 [Gallintestinimicrobium sp.]
MQGGNGNCCMVWRMPEPGELDNSGRKAGSRLRSFGFYCPEKEC